MQEKEVYEELRIEVIEFETEDVITTSGDETEMSSTP